MRGIAAFSVLIFHYSLNYDRIYHFASPPPFQFSIGFYGVHLFFIISGFVISATLQRSETAWKFWINRTSRLYPAYWIAVCTTFAAVYVFSLPGREVTFFEAAINLSMLEFAVRIPYVDGVYWTLVIELIFYAIYSSMHFSKLRNYKIYAFTLLVLLSVATQSITNAFNYEIPLKIRYLILIDYSYLFGAGIALFEIRNGRCKREAILLLIVSAFAAIYTEKNIGSFLTIIFIAAIYICTSPKFKFNTSPILLFFGYISYPLYLIHQNIGYIVIRYTDSAGYKFWVSIILATIVSIIIATTIHFFIEEPAQKRIRKAFTSKIQAADS